MDVYNSRIKKIELIDESKYKVSINIFNYSEIERVLTFENSEDNFKLHDYNYEFIIEKVSMQPLGEAVECMAVYHAHETPENLNPRLRRQWLMASIIDNMTDNLIANNILRVYTTEED